MARRIPSVFPLENGTLNCLSCHDVAWHCKPGRLTALPNRSFLRGEPVPHPLAFCFQCHERQNYRPFNAHDQLEAGEIKTDTCAWCHIGVPDVKSRLAEGASYALRSESFGVCNNCHLVNKGRPTGDLHMYATPPVEMIWHMSAYEMQPQMHVTLKQLREYVRAAKRKPRSIPLDEKGRITCYSCHNPHEKGLLPDWNLRSVGAKPVDCLRSCHIEEPTREIIFTHSKVRDHLEGSVHALTADDGTPRSHADDFPRCKDCHDIPLFRPVSLFKTVRAGVSEHAINRCVVCHSDEHFARYFYSHVTTRMHKARDPREVVAICSSCHADAALTK